ncbi:ABC transporter permease subunit [Mycetocola zhadangensis]|uniref:ABC transporter permease n=1 Tax=Mycetocola zhadangensis TaxID=1164595 RepID=A0A3L7IYP6_9MICO|nr:ABC transporter permease subunit [Mycetocola zhadangensis]RLQ82551.1 ABC transporter permease [Mycetocola zhadangensis]GGF00356.1 ABC transporter permease [Mycetocola zhadangensis]
MTATEKHRATFVAGPDGLTFVGVLRSEIIKLTSLRSTVGLLLSIIVFGLAVSVALGLTMEDAGLPDAPSAGFMLDNVTIGTVLFGQLIAGILGVLVISGEYASGTIQSTLIAAPSRLTVLAAKAVVLFVSATAAAGVALFGSWAITYRMFAAFGLEIGLTAPGVTFALLGGSVYVGFSAVLGLGIGTMLRSVAASVATVLSVILLLPVVLSVLPASPFVRNLHLLSMSKAGDAMTSLADPGGAFLHLADGYVSPAAAWIIAAAWAGVFLLLGAVRLRRGDA